MSGETISALLRNSCGVYKKRLKQMDSYLEMFPNYSRINDINMTVALQFDADAVNSPTQPADFSLVTMCITLS